MPNELIYPDLTHGTLVPFNIIISGWETDPDYFLYPECPYDEDIILFLAPLNPHLGLEQDPEVGGGVTVTSSITSLESVEHELHTILSDLTEYVADNKKKLKPNEAMQAYKTRMGIVDKLTTIQMKVAGLKEVHEFQDEIISIIDEVLSPEQRTVVMDKLRDAVMGTVDLVELSKIVADDDEGGADNGDI